MTNPHTPGVSHERIGSKTSADLTDEFAGGRYKQISDSIASKAEESQQLDDRHRGKIRGSIIQPPFDPAIMAELMELNITHAKSVFSKARNVGGYGLEIVKHPDVEEPDETQKEVARNFWFGSDSKWQVGPIGSERSTPADVLEMAWIDYEGIGWLSIEILTTMDGMPMGLSYVPAMTVRLRKDKPGYAQLKRGRVQYFGAAGDRYQGLTPEIVSDGDAVTVRYEVSEDAGDRVLVDSETGDAGESVDNPANELIFKRNHSPLYTNYGAPDIAPGISTVRADDEAESYNIDFFENDGVPRMAIVVEGGQLTQGARTDIQNLIHGMKDQPHRTIILEAEKLLESKQDSFNLDGDEDDLRIRLEPLTIGNTEDASFDNFRDRNEHEILKAHEVPPIEAGAIKSGAFSTDAEAQRKGYIETVIRPKQEAFEQLIYETVHAALGVTDWTIRLKNRGIDTRLSDAQVANARISASQGAMTINEARHELDMGPLTDVDGTPDPRGDMLLAELGNAAGRSIDDGDTEDEERSTSGNVDRSVGGVQHGRPQEAPPPKMFVGKRFDVVFKGEIDSTQFDSSNLQSGLYDYGTQDLYIRFHGDPSDRIYIYQFVPPETWDGLKTASSHGSYHHENIKWTFPYEEITASEWPQQGRAAPIGDKVVQAFLEA